MTCEHTLVHAEDEDDEQEDDEKKEEKDNEVCVCVWLCV